MSRELLTARRLAMVTTLKCTLKCKLCCNFMQKFEKPYDVPLNNILNDIDHIFEIFDYIDWFQFVGGEIFVNKEMEKIYRYLIRYNKKFGKLILMTNGTIAPRTSEVEALKKYGKKCEVMISDYGKCSYKIDEMINVFEKENIPYIVKKYHGDVQYYGGWVDNTSFDRFMGSDVELMKQIASCPQVNMKNMHCLNGKLHKCSNSCFMTELGVSTPDASDYVDLNNTYVSVDEKRKIISDFYNKPAQACKICSFKNMNNIKRFPAAEQIK